jgi:hypothetical protein
MINYLKRAIIKNRVIIEIPQGFNIFNEYYKELIERNLCSTSLLNFSFLSSK